MNVREYMHDITAQNANTLASEEGQAEGKKKMTKEETLQEQQSKNKDLTMHMYKVLANRTKALDESRRSISLRVSDVVQKIMGKVMEKEPMFNAYFSNPLTGEDVELKIEQADTTRYEMRVFLKSFPLPNSLQMNFGLQYNVPHGCAEVAVNQHMGRVEKMIIKSDWAPCMEGDTISPTRILPWFTDGIRRAVKSIQLDNDDPDHNKVSTEPCEKGIQLIIMTDDKKEKGKKNSISSIQQETSSAHGHGSSSAKPISVSVTCIVSLRGTGVPKGMRLQHALPNREPYSTQGKKVVDDMTDEITEGRSLYTLDACMDPEEDGQPAIGFWETNFKFMTERVMHGARTFGKNNLIDPAIHVIEMISISRHWDIPTSIIETAALWEYKKSANKIRNEAMCFKNVLTRLHGFFQSQSCPHFLLANYNMLKLEDEAWCDVIAKEIGDAITTLDDDPGRLLDLTGTNKKKEKKDTLIEEGDTTSLHSQSVRES